MEINSSISDFSLDSELVFLDNSKENNNFLEEKSVEDKQSLDDIIHLIKNNIKKNQSHSNKFKCLVVELARKYGKGGKLYASTISRCSLSSVYDWEKQYDKLKATKRQDGKRLPGGGRKSVIMDYEKKIILWIVNCRKNGMGISIKSIMTYLYSLNKEFREMSFPKLYHIIYRLIKRHNLSIRKVSHVGKTLPDNSIYSFYQFFCLVCKKRKELNITDDEKYRLINCDETPIFLEMPDTTTIDIKGHKEIIIDTNGNEKKRITVLLTVAGDGTKLEPILVFQGKKGKNVEKELQGNRNIALSKCYAYTQEYSWVDSHIFNNWYKNIYLKYEKLIGKKCLLILDKSPSHIDDRLIDKFEKNGTNYVFIPGGLTRYLQPLDIGVNKVFKECLKNEYRKSEFNFEDRNNHKNLKNVKILKDRRHFIVNAVNDIWYDDRQIKKESIINSFFKASITFRLDGSDDDSFEFPDKFSELDTVYDNFGYQL